MTLTLCGECGLEIQGDNHRCAPVFDLKGDEQARWLAIQIHEMGGGELLAETMAAADTGSAIAKRALQIRAELRRLDEMGITGTRKGVN